MQSLPQCIAGHLFAFGGRVARGLLGSTDGRIAGGAFTNESKVCTGGTASGSNVFLIGSGGRISVEIEEPGFWFKTGKFMCEADCGNSHAHSWHPKRFVICTHSRPQKTGGQSSGLLSSFGLTEIRNMLHQSEKRTKLQ